MTPKSIASNARIKNKIRLFFSCFIAPLLRFLSQLFGFNERYLRGRYFDDSLQGWLWLLRAILIQKILGFNRHVPWPISPSIAVDDPAGIIFNPDDIQNFMHHGCYFSNVNGGVIKIGKGTLIAPNVGIITTNHLLNSIEKHAAPRNVIIGNNCWIGMNCVILPGVHLGDNTIVAAGAVVTSSYPEGHCVLGGVPAKILKKLI